MFAAGFSIFDSNVCRDEGAIRHYIISYESVMSQLRVSYESVTSQLRVSDDSVTSQ